MSSPSQLLIWTALPNGYADPETLQLSLFLSPQLSTGGGNLGLSSFPDFVNWPEWISGAPGGPISFMVQFGSGAPVPATITSAAPDQSRWAAYFVESQTYVQDHGSFGDFSKLTRHSFDVKATYDQVENIYQSFGVSNPYAPPTMTGSPSGGLSLPKYSPVQSAVTSIMDGVEVAATTGRPITTAVSEAVAYYAREMPPSDSIFTPSVPIFDFHQGIASLGHYFVLLRLFGLVFDVTIPLSSAPGNGNSTVRAIPSWTSNFPSAQNRSISPYTACTLSPSDFITQPAAGSTDYANRMLNLADQTRFSVTELDVDGAAQSVQALALSMQSLQAYQASLGALGQYQSYSMALPALRTTGPSVIWTGFADELGTLMTNQDTLNTALQKYLAKPSLSKLPVFHAPDVTRGHRIDVYSPDDPTPQWRSLHQRSGQYSFGPLAGTGAQAQQYANLALSNATDEGFVTPGASQQAPTVSPPPPPDLYIHEEIARWNGWSLSVPRIGGALTTSDGFDPTPGSEAVADTDGDGNTNPQMSVDFSVVPYLPKLRFGQRYSFRARGVDLACNSADPASQDSSTATPLFTYRRFQPVLSPTMAATAPFSPGQGTLLLALLNWSLGEDPAPLGRWLFPPKVGQLLAEQHGMFDGFSLGNPPDPNQPPDGTKRTYDEIVQLDQGTLTDIGGYVDSVAGGYWFDSPDQLETPWIPDPLSSGIAIVGLPGAPANRSTVDPWQGGVWPQFEAELLLVQPGPQGSSPVTEWDAGDATDSPVRTLTLPPAAVLDLQVSSSITDPTLLGVYQWVMANPPAGEAGLYAQLAQNGQMWLLSPYVTLRVAHATRLPQTPFGFVAPAVTERTPGSTDAQIYDLSFEVDGASTSSIDVTAVWTDPLDDPNDPNDPDQDPGPRSSNNSITTTAAAFKVTVPDPDPPLPTDQPGFVVPAPTTFALGEMPGVTHDIGDTHHHYISYTPTATSRFAEFFRPQRPIPASEWTAVGDELYFTDSQLGLNAASVDITTEDGLTVLVQGTDYTVDEQGGGVILQNPAYVNTKLIVDYEPTVTIDGPTTSFHVLASAPPSVPAVDRVMPAFEIRSGGAVSTGAASFERFGGWLRVWLDRPWWSSGAGEMLGVVCLPRQHWTTQPLADPYDRLATVVGLDPISVADPSLRVQTTPMDMGNWVSAPTDVPGIKYSSPPACALLEDPSTKYTIYPYAVTYDEGSDQWYADVQMVWPGLQLPPPGYFVRLALVRFQPYAYSWAQVSKVALATFAQPVVDRVVSVVKSGPQTVRVTVAGPGYQGFRPANQNGPDGSTVYDLDNQFALQPYSGQDGGQPVTSTMVVDIQSPDTSLGLSGELAWAPVAQPVVLGPTFEGPLVVWTGTVTLPYPIGDETPMRARVSELDYYTGSGAPATVDTSLRRSFVAHISIS